MTSKKNKNNKNKELSSILILGLTISILASTLYFVVNMVLGFSDLMHHQKMQELNLQKEIALINSGQTIKDSLNITETYYLIRDDTHINNFCKSKGAKSGYISIGVLYHTQCNFGDYKSPNWKGYKNIEYLRYLESIYE